MKIAVYSTKGGVGKTSIAFSLAIDLNYIYITNDLSTSIQKYRYAKYYPKKIPLYDNTIYDFGGFKSSYVDEIINEMDLFIIPTINDVNAMFKTIECLKQLIGKKVIIVANVIENMKDFTEIKMVLNHYFNNVNYIYMRKSKLLKNSIINNTSALKLSETTHLYNNSLKDYQNLLSKIKESLKELTKK